jgi:predicted O-methyltransferase YrrM
LIFIDGSHAYDNVFIDFYLTERHLNPGGILVFDDVSWPGVERVSHYVVTNRDYEIIASLPRQVDNDTAPSPLISMLKHLGERLARTHRTPLARHQQDIKRVNRSEMIAFRTPGGNIFETSFHPF